MCMLPTSLLKNEGTKALGNSFLNDLVIPYILLHFLFLEFLN